MRLWLRIALTLILAPLARNLVAAYIAVGQGATWASLRPDAGKALLELYLSSTLPALALVVVVLVPAGLALRRIGCHLLIVAVAPLLAVLVPVILSLVTAIPRLQAGAVLSLALAYGLVYGLTVREPRANEAVNGVSG